MEIFAPKIGHPEVQAKILRSIRQHRLPHAYLFHGPEGSGKEAFALALAQLLNAGTGDGQIDRQSPQYRKIATLQHPDIKLIIPTPAKTNVKDEEILEALREKAANPYRRILFSGRNIFIGIDTIRELKKEAGFKLYEGRKKVFILTEADLIRVEAANALLKLLEEPPDNLMLILVTANINKLLPTIKSRCQLVRFSPLSEEQIMAVVKQHAPEVDEKSLPLLIRLSGYNLKRTFDFLEYEVVQLRDQAIEFLRKVVLIHRSQELMEIIEPLAAKKDRAEAQLLLWFLLLWFQDILHLQKLDSDAQALNNIDKRDTLKKFMAFTPNADIGSIVWEIETALQDLADARNFNPLLILANLAIKLNEKLKKQ